MGVQNIDHFIDDVLTRTATWDDHIKALKDLFQRARKADLTIRPTKFDVGYDEVEFLGHKVSCNRITMDENKLLKIQDAAPPKTKTQVRSFLGLTGYYRKFVNNYAGRGDRLLPPKTPTFIRGIGQLLLRRKTLQR